MLCKRLQTITRADFPLPTLGPKLEALRDNVVNGKGFHLIQGRFLIFIRPIQLLHLAVLGSISDVREASCSQTCAWLGFCAQKALVCACSSLLNPQIQALHQSCRRQAMTKPLVMISIWQSMHHFIQTAALDVVSELKDRCGIISSFHPSKLSRNTSICCTCRESLSHS